MRRTNFVPAAALSVALAMTLAACEAQKSENPLSPSVAGPIPGVEITAPQMLEPSQGARYKENQQPIKLAVGNASSNGVRPLYYTFEVATDSGFQTKMFARSQVQPGAGTDQRHHRQARARSHLLLEGARRGWRQYRSFLDRAVRGAAARATRGSAAHHADQQPAHELATAGSRRRTFRAQRRGWGCRV